MHKFKLDTLPGTKYEYNGNAMTIRERDQLIVASDESLFDLFLWRGDNRMGELLTQVHRDEGHNFDGLARAGRLFDKNIFGRSANIRDQSDLVRA